MLICKVNLGITINIDVLLGSLEFISQHVYSALVDLVDCVAQLQQGLTPYIRVEAA
jgi:hypothetical protein